MIEHDDRKGTSPGEGPGGTQPEEWRWGVREFAHPSFRSNRLICVCLSTFVPTDPEHRDTPCPARGLQYRAPTPEP